VYYKHRRGDRCGRPLPWENIDEKTPYPRICHPGFWEKVLFHTGQCRVIPVFDTRYARVGVYICYDRHFSRKAQRILGAQTARRLSTILRPTVAGLSEYLWELEQPGDTPSLTRISFAAINRVWHGSRPWKDWRVFMARVISSAIHAGRSWRKPARDKDELLVADLKPWRRFSRSAIRGSSIAIRRPESYGEITRTRGGGKTLRARGLTSQP